MVANRQPTLFTEAEYLALEGVAAVKHEYTQGLILAMAGAEFTHNRIAMNAAVELSRLLTDGPCAVVGSDQRVKVEATREYFYPDVSVVCGPPRLVGPAPRSLTNPSLVVEVLSPSTAAYDAGEKLDAYRRIATLTDYLVVASDRRHVTHYQRSGPESWAVTTHGGGDTLTLAIGVTLAIDPLYRMVEDL